MNTDLPRVIAAFSMRTRAHLATAQVSGNFPGSPARIRYKFTLKGDKIAALAIGT